MGEIETEKHKVRKWDDVIGREGNETFGVEVTMGRGGVDQEAGKQERAKMSEWTWDDLAVWSNLLLCADGVAKTLSVFILALGIAITSGTISKKSLLF